MGAWSELTLAVVENAMPTDMAVAYAAWLAAHPSKAGRLEEIVDEVVARFRGAVESNPACELDEEETTVPTSGFGHALNSVLFNLGMEMGVEFSSVVEGLITRADIWLRMVEAGSINPVSCNDGRGTPRYFVPREETRGMLL